MNDGLTKHQRYRLRHLERINDRKRELYNERHADNKASYVKANRDKINAYKRSKRVGARATEKAKILTAACMFLLYSDSVTRFITFKTKRKSLTRFGCPIFASYSKTDLSRLYGRMRAHTPEFKAVSARKKFNRKTRLENAINDLTASQWIQIKLAYENRCAYWYRKALELTQDHVLPVSKGGHHTASNIVPACRSCNSSKGAKYKPESLRLNPFTI